VETFGAMLWRLQMCEMMTWRQGLATGGAGFIEAFVYEEKWMHN
jgi:hypothetical protein